MLKLLLKSKIIISIVIVASIIVGSLFIYIPKITEQNIINTVIRNSQNTVEQIKLNRAYYVSSVVKDVKKYAPQLTFDYEHEGENGKLPFPTTTIHNLSKIYSENTGLTFHFYSNYPFKPKVSRELTPLQKEALDYVEKNDKGMWVKRDTIDGKPVLRVAVADYMTDPSCVSCHNSHNDKTWEKNHWKLGDKRGVLEVITPLDEDFKANKQMRDQILLFISGALSLLVVYYSIILIRRESELLSANDILDTRVKEEVEKNLSKEKQLISQSRTAAMGEMMGAIIHQWKQPLNSISIANSSVDMHILMDDFDKELLSKQTKNINEQVEYMNNTMNDFRNFFKTTPKSCFELNQSINDVMKLIGKVYAVQKVKVELDLAPESVVEAYPNELKQVIINILNNARDAILEFDPEIKIVFIKTFKENDFVYMTIDDCAGGIPEEIIDRIFEPYVTTKSDDKGTGIGLDMSKNIIEKAGGVIKAQNIVTSINGKGYKGARFTIGLKSCKDKD